MTFAALNVAVPGVVTAIRGAVPAEHSVRSVQRLESSEGRERGLYDAADGDMTIDLVARSEPTELVIRSVRTEGAFGGTWMHRSSPTRSGCEAARGTLA